MIYHCCDNLRRNLVDQHAALNGIDYLEVLDNDAPIGSPRQQTLLVKLLKPVPVGLGLDNIAIIGGDRIRNPQVNWAAPADSLPVDEVNAAEQTFLSGLSEADHILVVRTESPGDFSNYCLRLQRSVQDELPPVGIDPLMAEVTFSFKVECPSDFDCKPLRLCPTDVSEQPDINYLARDYASFRQLILDRMTQLLPDWRRRNAADLGVMLAEVMAYAGDQLSYWLDAVSTEAYLDTARRRTSLRRHALLVDYHISEGRNARCWIYLEVSAGPVILNRNEVQFFTKVVQLPAQIEPASRDEQNLRLQRPLVFEPLQEDMALYPEHNSMELYTWENSRCCLGKEATHATLTGHYANLEANDFLLFEEVLGPLTGVADDADPGHRHVVRLLEVELTEDPLNDQQVTQIRWALVDALPFPLCISSEHPEEETLMENVSLARGNIILADHGETIVGEELGQVPEPLLYFPADQESNRCDPDKKKSLPLRFQPRLQQGPITQGVRDMPDVSAPAAKHLNPALNGIVPQIISLSSTDSIGNQPWTVKRDLLNSADNDYHVVVETEQDGSAYLRFGDDLNGRRPESGMSFTVSYRVGNGIAGNIGADAIHHALSNDTRIVAVRNPLPAQSGLNPETPAQIRRRAPQAFRTQLRAVTPKDYADFTEQYNGVQQAAAGLRWTGSWYTQFVTVDREDGLSVDGAFEQALQAHIEPYRMAGHDLEFNDPVFVSLEMDMRICVERNYFRNDVKQALLAVFNSGLQTDGQLGLFHPDRFSFGQTVYLSPFYATARQVAGVSSVQITRFHKQGNDNVKPLADGFMKLEGLQIARLDNSPNFPERGVLRLEMIGGK